MDFRHEDQAQLIMEPCVPGEEDATGDCDVRCCCWSRGCCLDERKGALSDGMMRDGIIAHNMQQTDAAAAANQQR